MLTFLHPAFLFALFALSIPVIIHLFHFRRFRKIYFSNITFLNRIKTEKQSKNRLKKLIILLLRLLAITCLVLAFAQPFIKNPAVTLKSGNSAISIYIDNSFSMENKIHDNSLLDEAKKITGQIIRGSGRNDVFQVLSNDFSLKQQRFFTGKDIMPLLNEITTSPFNCDIRSVLLRQTDALQNQKASNKIAYVISDFQKSTTDLEKLHIDNSVITYFIQVKPEEASNFFIDSAWFESPIIKYSQTAELSVRLRNMSDKAVEETAIRLNINGNEKALANFNIGAGQSIIIKLPFTVTNTGWNRCKLYITDYPVIFDDEYYFCFYVNPKTDILCINGNGSNNFIKTVYATDNYFNLEETDANNINPGNFNNYRLIILNEMTHINSGLINQLQNFVSGGGNILFIPSSDEKLLPKDYNNFLSAFNSEYFTKKVDASIKVSEINTHHPLLSTIFEKNEENVNLPSVKRYYEKAIDVLSTDIVLIKLENDQPLLSLNTSGKGNLFVYSVPLNTGWTNYTRHAIFVPVMYQIALYSALNLPLSSVIGKSKFIEINNYDSTATSAFKLYSNNTSFIPDYKFMNGKINISLDEKFRKSGFYYLLPEYMQKTDAVSLSGYPVFALNYDRKESEMNFYSSKDLKQLSKYKGFNLLTSKTGNLRYEVQNMDKGKPFWKLFILLTLVFLLSEVLVLRFMKI